MKSLSSGLVWRSWLGVVVAAWLTFGLVMVPGCGRKRSTPEKAVKTYLAALKRQDVDGMLECCVPDQRENLEKLSKVVGKKKLVELLAGAGKLEKFNVLDMKVEGDGAEVEVSLTVGGKKRTETYPLRKIKGEWLLGVPGGEQHPGTRRGQGKDERMAQETVQKLFDAMKVRDLNALVPCYAPEAQKLFREAISAAGKAEVEQTITYFNFTISNFEILDTKVDDGRAEVKASLTILGKKKRETYSLQKIKGRWLVEMEEGDERDLRRLIEWR